MLCAGGREGGQDKNDGKLTLSFYYYYFCDYFLSLELSYLL
jgi:hypothetical protein